MLYASEYLNHQEEMRRKSSRWMRLLKWMTDLTEEGYLADLLHKIKEFGPFGYLILFAVFIIFSFPIPIGTTPLALSAGFMYGFWTGFVVVSIFSLVGAGIGFWACRVLLKQWVEERVLRPEVSGHIGTALLKAIETHAFKLVVLVRNAPIPFGIQNGLFAVSRIGFRTFLIATFLGLLPEQLMLVYFGSKAGSFTEILAGDSTSNWKTIILLGELLISLVILIVLSHTGRKAYNEALQSSRVVHSPLDIRD